MNKKDLREAFHSFRGVVLMRLREFKEHAADNNESNHRQFKKINQVLDSLYDEIQKNYNEIDELKKTIKFQNEKIDELVYKQSGLYFQYSL